MKNYLRDLVKKKVELSNFSFEYESGHLEFHSRLKIFLSSSKIIHWKIPKKTPFNREKEVAKIRETEISEEKILVFVEETRKRKIWDLENCTQKALPGAPLLTFRIKHNGQVVFDQQVWENCRNDSIRVKELIRALGALLPQDWTPP
ncbi:MAG: hypothetical protein E4H14_02230 [Candidatus Thorarchaeota archaeon]|nr:MAG: hypothetical protein E4H14_02230 [Candidatus Thorarchaeota archaeon]